MVKPLEMEELAALHGDTDFIVIAHSKKELLGQSKWKMWGFYSRQVAKCNLTADLTGN